MKMALKGWGHQEELRTFQFLLPVRKEQMSQEMFEQTTPETQQYLTDGGLLWSCRYLGEDGECQIYESRPSMCRTFPTNDPLKNEDGTNPLCHQCSSSYCGFHPSRVSFGSIPSTVS